MHHDDRFNLWNDPALLRKLRQRFAHAEVMHLSELRSVYGPCVYGLFLGADPTGMPTDALAELGGTGLPINIGAQTGTDFRPSRYRKSIETIDTLRLDDWLVSVVPVATCAQALGAERVLQEHYRPVFNEHAFAGLGSNRQGRNRVRGQKASPFDTLFEGARPGRSARVGDAARRQELIDRLTHFLADAPHREPLIHPSAGQEPTLDAAA